MSAQGRTRQLPLLPLPVPLPTPQLLPLLLVAAGGGAAQGMNCAAHTCCAGGTCPAACCEPDGHSPCGGNSCTDGDCRARTCAPPPPLPPATRPLGPGHWFPDCSGRGQTPQLDGFVCFTEVGPFVGALNATIPPPTPPYGRPSSVDCAGPNCRLALVCLPEAPCALPSELCMFPYPSPLGMQWDFTESCLFLMRNMDVFLMNVVLGPHTSAYPMGGGGGLLYVSDNSSFTGVNVTFVGGQAVMSGGAVTLNQGHLACASV